MPINREAIKELIKAEFAKGLSCTHRLVGHARSFEVNNWPMEGSSCGDYAKCVMGAILCSSGFTIKEVYLLQQRWGASILSMPYEVQKAVYNAFGLWPHHSWVLMYKNDNNDSETIREIALLDSVDNLVDVVADLEFPDNDTYGKDIHVYHRPTDFMDDLYTTTTRELALKLLGRTA